MGVLAVAIQGNASDISTVRFAPPSSWVKPHFFNQQSSTSLLDSSADQHWLLLERQINALENETFFTPSGRFSRWPAFKKAQP